MTLLDFRIIWLMGAISVGEFKLCIEGVQPYAGVYNAELTVSPEPLYPVPAGPGGPGGPGGPLMLLRNTWREELTLVYEK